MHIIIVGCGKVGRTLAEQLQEEETDLTLIDMDADVINDLTEDIDAMGIVGNGASINTLMEAGVQTADILIAVTGSDELNLLCCLFCFFSILQIHVHGIHIFNCFRHRTQIIIR